MPLILFILIFLVSCGGMTKEAPTSFSQLTEEAPLYPDYRDVAIPYNIAPLNVMVDTDGEAFAGTITSASGKQIVAQTNENKLPNNLKQITLSNAEMIIGTNKTKNLRQYSFILFCLRLF